MSAWNAFWDNLFGRKAPVRRAADDDDAGASAGGPPSNLDQALPTLAAVLRALGEHAFETDVPARTARERFGGWADHVEAGAPPPDRPGAARARQQRDWAALKSFVADRRRAEKDYVVTSARELRETLWTFIQRLTTGFAEDRRSDGHVEGQLKKLRAAVDSPSLDVLRREVLGAVEEIRRLAEDRAIRSRRDLEASVAELTTLRQELDKARREAMIDPLTQLYNRGAFDEHVGSLAALRPLSGTPSTLMMLDIDRFKNINDRYGHPAGDEVLKALADCMVRTLPRRTDFIARYGGEEFAVVLQQDGARVGHVLGEKLLGAVRALAIHAGGEELHITVSAGLAEIEEGESAADWVKRADQALYEAKHQGRDRLVESSAAVGAVHAP